VCTHDEVLEKVLPAKTLPLSCRELATEIIDWIKFYKLKEIDLIKQQLLLSPLADVEAQLSEVTVEVVRDD